jgi:hypothetical protein
MYEEETVPLSDVRDIRPFEVALSPTRIIFMKMNLAPCATKRFIYILKNQYLRNNRLCNLVVRVPSFRTRGPGSIPGATKFSEK